MAGRGTLLGLLLLPATALAQAPTAPATTPAPTTTAPATPAPAPTPPPADREVIYQGEATSILGRQVRDPSGEVIGRIVDVLVDDAGQPRAAVIDFGGFMGVGNRRVAVSWRAMRFVPTQARGTISLDMTAAQISATPDFKRPRSPEDPPVSVAAPPRPAPPAAPAPVDPAPANPASSTQAPVTPAPGTPAPATPAPATPAR